MKFGSSFPKGIAVCWCWEEQKMFKNIDFISSKMFVNGDI